MALESIPVYVASICGPCQHHSIRGPCEYASIFGPSRTGVAPDTGSVECGVTPDTLAPVSRYYRDCFICH